MNSNGFGFNPNNDDDDEDRRNNQNPFSIFGFGSNGFQGFHASSSGSGAGDGGLGDILNQFGQMLSGFGSSFANQEPGSPVNYEIAERTAERSIGNVPALKESDRAAIDEAVKLVELWLDDATILPTSNSRVETWNALDWLRQTLPMWKRMVTPVAQRMNESQLDNVPEEAREMLNAAASMMQQMSSMQVGIELGRDLGELATQALSGSDFGVPVSPTGVIAILPGHMAKMTKDLPVPPQDAMVYLCALEAARQRLFKHVPWLTERLIASVEEYAAGLEMDSSHVEDALRNINLEGDFTQIQDAMSQLQDFDFSPRITSRNAGATSRLETLLALIEGWVEYVVTEALSERIPSTIAMNQAWRHRRATGGSAEQAFSKVVGIEFSAPKVSEALELWRRVTVAVGAQRRDKIWDHPDFLPVASDLENSAEFIDGLLAEGDDFDPIAEIDALEKMLAEEADKKDDTATKNDGENNDEDPKDDDTKS
ncbi:zinc-dependent metalloprotease [Corynebacterium freiburgense]|uniref:zinc-dependent metalloprotease n=1 Tax=Corynebacterium freiburgense TaxID=556548 RepID=UPI000556A747|nr:zinc-dependent metalloprotease [Corynebacterium freiburgense]WJZ01953.1 hypothetical protein CFREI_03245 [Corynebacterium freiburgense]